VGGSVVKLSILIPVYNESRTLSTLLDRTLQVDIGAEKEIIVVDDASTDGTAEILESYRNQIIVIRHAHNRGKGAALRTALGHATGQYIVPQDADLEYDPADLARLLEAARTTGRKVVYGSRRLNPENRRQASLAFYLGGILVTWMANLLYGLRLADEATCYKLIDRQLLESMDLQCERFEFCPEVTAKAARMGHPILEIPITYRPRSRNEGKKIRGSDGLQAIHTLIRYIRWCPRSKT
jgi:glycosyltransferase involved in cell wall biosynthesis